MSKSSETAQLLTQLLARRNLWLQMGSPQMPCLESSGHRWSEAGPRVDNEIDVYNYADLIPLSRYRSDTVEKRVYVFGDKTVFLFNPNLLGSNSVAINCLPSNSWGWIPYRTRPRSSRPCSIIYGEVASMDKHRSSKTDFLQGFYSINNPRKLNINSEVVIKNDMLQVYTWRRFPFFLFFMIQYDSIILNQHLWGKGIKPFLHGKIS